MLIIDLQQIAIANLMAQLGQHTNAQLQPDMLRHLILNSLRSIRKKFGGEYGEMVVATDNRHSWRKDIFPQYKASRKSGRAKSEMDWGMIFDTLAQLREELRDNFPYRVIHVDGCEADDVIGTLCEQFGNESDMAFGESILIVSGDKDFRQLQKYGNVSQYDPTRKKWITESDPRGYLREHVMRGDVGDGVPNVLSDDDTFVNPEKRQTPLTAKKLKQLLDSTLMDRNVERNRTMIDLSYTPQRLKDEVIDQYEAQAGKGRDKIFPYFMKHRLKNLTELLGDF